MTDAIETTMIPKQHLSLFEKTVLLSSWAVVGALFLTIGSLVMEPDDPLAAVSMLTKRRAILMVVQTAALSAVAAAIATVIAGRLLPDVGTFAAAVGLAAVSLQGGTTANLLAGSASDSVSASGWLAAKLAVESLGWFLVVAAALSMSGVVTRWQWAAHLRWAVCRLFGLARGQEEDGRNDASSARCNRFARCNRVPMLAVSDIPRFGSLLTPDAGSSTTGGGRYMCRTNPVAGLKHTFVAGVSALAAMSILSASVTARSIQHGQSCFVVAASVCIASYIAWRLVPVRSALWSILSVLLLALGGYGWACVSHVIPTAGPVVDLPAAITTSAFLRVLPLQYISVGTAAAIAMFWYVRPRGFYSDSQDLP